MDLIIAHGHCPDGFTAAMIAKLKYPEAEVMFLDHGLSEAQLETLFSECEGSDVLMLDYSLRTRELNDRLNELTKEFRILDHHKTAQAVLEGAPYAVFDMTRSGAGLAFDYLFGKDSNYHLPENGPTVYNPAVVENMPPLKRPWFVDYVEDRDLWNWKLENSREVCAYLGTLPFEFEAWQHLYKIDPYTAFLRGTGALAHINHYTREAVKQAQTGVLQGRKTAVLNVPYLNCSEVGAALAKTHEVSLTWFERGDGVIQFSLRSVGDIDVSAIAKCYDGGGHRNAAGFQLPLGKGRRLVDVMLGRNDV